ncbi:MAG: rRNA pseudouridine synthase [Chloroflexota bacterium]|nr:rRNA pseudouridine synthase [Chloroflexota bacterium]
MRERLQKILARAGHGSRRAAESLITAGRVSVNGATVTALGTQADAKIDRIELDGKRLSLAETAVFLAMNKPDGVLTTLHDPEGRRTVLDLLPPALPPHVFPIGRLDRDTEGLLLFTNDGEFAHRMAHPRYEIEKEYYAQVTGTLSDVALGQLRNGVLIEGKRTSPAAVDVTLPPSGRTAWEGHVWLRIVIHEGRKRQVRLMCRAVGHPVRTLVRTRVGPITLARLASGTTRQLSDNEVRQLKSLLGLSAGEL